MNKKTYVLVSGGLDSSAVLFHLLRRGFIVYPLYIVWNPYVGVHVKEFKIVKMLYNKYKTVYPELHQPQLIYDRQLISNIQNNITYRNRLLLDKVIDLCLKAKIYYLGMGEYKGSDNWVYNSGPPVEDCDTKYLDKYILNKSKGKIKLITLDNFGIATYKNDRFRICYEVLGEDTFLTTSCRFSGDIDCGGKFTYNRNSKNQAPYLCVERHIAALKVLGYDKRKYLSNPEDNIFFIQYCRQMNYLQGILKFIKEMKFKQFDMSLKDLIKIIQEVYDEKSKV